jgi:hypothetical protein
MINIINSPIWTSLKGGGGGDGQLAASLLDQIYSGDESAFDELLHQVCHQFTTSNVAYAVVPHLVNIAESSPVEKQVRPLSIIGSVVAACAINDSPKIPEELVEDYSKAKTQALSLTTDLLKNGALGHVDLQEMVAVVSALRGLSDLAMLIFLSGGQEKLTCPECGEEMCF